MIGLAVHGFVELGNSWYELGCCWDPDLGWPMFHPIEEVHEPLTCDIIAYQDDEELDETDDGANNVIHVGITKVTISFHF